MAYIKTLKNSELVGGTDNTEVYPITSTQAIYSQKSDGSVPDGIKHQKLEERLEDIEEDTKNLSAKTNKLIAYIEVDKANQILEITGEPNTITLAGYAFVESFGDVEAAPVAIEDMTAKNLSISYSSASTSITGETQGNKWVGTYILPNISGIYTAKFDCIYNNVSKSATAMIRVGLRTFFGFSEEQPEEVTDLQASYFGLYSSYTAIIPASGEGFKYIWFAIPANHTIESITQLDALNAPMIFTQVGTINRVVDSSIYTYKLYRSEDTIDSSIAKRLNVK